MSRTHRALLALALALPGLVSAQSALERKDVHLAVGGKAALYYLPLTVAEQLGYFKDEGLDLKISDFAGGSQSLRASGPRWRPVPGICGRTRRSSSSSCLRAGTS
jgi:ABC-type nitrate/sulfonate/bicarbonate transport system substrate-binding protein